MKAGGAIPALTENDIRALLPPRPRDSHKGANGKALLCVGSGPYTGAALLASAAALRAGCGILTAAVPGRVKPAFSALPEACCTAVNELDCWDIVANQNALLLLSGKQAAGIGCGMGAVSDASLLSGLLASKLPLVVDADGLNLLSRNRDLFSSLHENVVLTPHAGEMARLLDCNIADVLSAPEKAAVEAAARWHCIVLLKGATTYIASSETLVKNETGNPGLAKGGSGDVLTGLITGLLAQGLTPFDAASAGAYLLGVSADNAFSLLGNRMLMATDVISAVQMTLGQLTE